MAGFSGRELQLQLQRTRRAARRALNNEVIEVTKKFIDYQIAEEAKRLLLREYRFSAARVFGSSLERTLNQIPERTANASINAINAIERATIGDTPAAQRDNKDLKAIARRTARNMNKEILEAYVASFSGRSYRVGDPNRRSGEIEAFLRKNKIVRAEGHDVVATLAPAANDDNVPHIFRLNYGTQSLKGGAKAGQPVPTFAVTLIPGAPVSQTFEVSRRPGFYLPLFPFVTRLGPVGEIRLFPNSRGGKNSGQPSQGIAPSYFVERGIANAAQYMREDYRDLIQKWERRVSQIRLPDSTLK